MRGIGWQSLLAGMVVIVAVVLVSLIMLGPLAGFKLKDYLGLQPLIGTPGEPKISGSSFIKAPPSDQYEVIIWDCKDDCRDKWGSSPRQLCRSELGDEWNAVFVDCDDIDAEGDITFSKRDLSTIWDKKSWGWCRDSGDEDMAVTCFRGEMDVQAVLVDCKADCAQKEFSPESICQSKVGLDWHAYGVDCDEHDINTGVVAGGVFKRDFTTSWTGNAADGGTNGWCADSPDDDMVVFCTDESTYQSSDYTVLLYECSASPNDCYKAIDQSLDVFCQKFLPGDQRAINVDCRYITIDTDSGENVFFKRLTSTVWGDFDSSNQASKGSQGWCNRADSTTEIFDMAVTCKNEKIEYQCNDNIDNDTDGLIDFDGDGDPAKIDPGCYSDIDDNEYDNTYPNMELGVLVRDCYADCFKDGSSPNDWCQKNFSSDWYAIATDCDDLDANGDILLSYKTTRTFDQKWVDGAKDANNIGIGWCKDTGDEDMTITCLNNNTGKNVRIADIEVVLYDCKGDCNNGDAQPEKICLDKKGIGWHAFGVDCDVIHVDGFDYGVFVRKFSDGWGGMVDGSGSYGWCLDTTDDDMAVFCTNANIDWRAIRAVIVNCWAADCHDYIAWSPDRMCKDALSENYRALMVDVTDITLEGFAVTQSTPAKRYFNQSWNQDLDSTAAYDYVGWGAETFNGVDEDVAIICVPDSFSLFVA